MKFTNIPDHVVDHLLKVGEIFLASGSFTIGDRELGKYVEHLDGTLDAIEGLPIAALKKAIESVTDTIKFTVIEKPLATITHILFDMDGLLLDTEVLYTVAQNKILETFGIKFSAEVKSMMMGRKALEAAEIMVRSQKFKYLGFHFEYFAHRIEQPNPKIQIRSFANFLILYKESYNPGLFISSYLFLQNQFDLLKSS